MTNIMFAIQATIKVAINELNERQSVLTIAAIRMLLSIYNLTLTVYSQQSMLKHRAR